MNPKDLAIQLMQQRMGNNPMVKNLFNLANQGNFNNIEQIARNLCKTKGINADEAFQNMLNQFSQKPTQ